MDEIAITNLLLIFTIVAAQAVTGIMFWRILKTARKTEANTNVMKDTLVQAVIRSAHSAGREESRIEGEARAAAVAEGAAQGHVMSLVSSEPLAVEVTNTDPVPVVNKKPTKPKQEQRQ